MNTEKRKNVGCGDHPGNALGGALSGEIEAEAADCGDLLKRPVLRLVIEEVGGGKRCLLQIGLGFPEPDELVRLGIGLGAQEDRVDDAEHGGVRTDTEGESENGDRSKATAFEQHAEAELNVREEVRHGALLFPGLDEEKAQKTGEPDGKRLRTD